METSEHEGHGKGRDAYGFGLSQYLGHAMHKPHRLGNF